MKSLVTKSLVALLALIGVIALMIYSPDIRTVQWPIVGWVAAGAAIACPIGVLVGYFIGSAVTSSPYEICHNCPAVRPTGKEGER